MMTVVDWSKFLPTVLLVLIWAGSSYEQADNGISKQVNVAAFCKSGDNAYFPTTPPEFHMPWVWDAVHDTSTKYVDITTVPHLACEFNKTLWHRILELHPQYSHQLSNGADANILVDIKVDKKQFDYVKSIFNAKFGCIFYSNGKEAYISTSLPVNVKGAFAKFSTSQIHCPVPPKATKWDSLSLERDMKKLARYNKANLVLDGNATTIFPVCKHFNSASLNASANTSSSKSGGARVYKYELSICTATQRSSREKLVEWIEYHLLQGVDHFYIYNTMYPAERQHELADMLTDYTQQGIVTLVPWPYANCMLGMGSSGRTISFIDPDHVNPATEHDFDRHRFWFYPPKRITQSSALASCYTRYRHTTRYMAQIDDDEFIKVALPRRQAGAAKPLLQYTNAMFAKFPTAPAIKLTPVLMVPCAVPATFDTTTHFGTLPRLGKHPFGRAAPVTDGKMVMRTDAVDMFFVHYLTALAKGVKQTQSLLAHPRNAVVLHYKTCAHLSGDNITGRRIPLNTTYESIEACNCSHFLPLDRPPCEELRAQQKEYGKFRDKQQQQLLNDSYCPAVLKYCAENANAESQECRNAKEQCAVDAVWNTTVLSEKEDFTSHYFEMEFIQLLAHNVQQRVTDRLGYGLDAQRHDFVVSPEAKASRLDVFLANSLPEYTRTFMASQCEKGNVIVNSRPQTKHYKISTGDSISIEVATPDVSDVTPENIKLDVIYEDEYMLAANKPVGMVVHPAVGTPNGTFANALLYHLGANASHLLAKIPTVGIDTASSEGMDEPQSHLRPGIVHRLDKGTSGVLLAGKSPQAVAALSNLFAMRQVRKVYIAVCMGHPGETTIDRPIGRSAKHRQQMCTYNGAPGKPAVTHVRTLCFDGRLSVCLMRIETGRTHQIRVHMKERRTPILGDEVYGTAEWNNRYRRTHQVRRPLLHAYESEFLHPFTGQKVSLKAPIPEDLARIISKIALHSGMNLEENEQLNSGVATIIDPSTGLLTCPTDVNEAVATLDTDVIDARLMRSDFPAGKFVPMDRVLLQDTAWPDGAVMMGEEEDDPFVWDD